MSHWTKDVRVRIGAIGLALALIATGLVLFGPDGGESAEEALKRERAASESGKDGKTGAGPDGTTGASETPTDDSVAAAEMAAAREEIKALRGLAALEAALVDGARSRSLRMAALERMLDWPDRDAVVRSFAKALGTIPRDSGADPQGRAMRLAIIANLARYVGQQKARALLIARLQPTTPRGERLAAIDALTRARSHWARPYLTPLTERGEDDVVRDRARAALEELGPPPGTGR